MKTITFFNNKGGVGKTTLVYHVAWMFHRLGARVLVADLDPQANLTSAFLDDERLARLWEASPSRTIYGAIEPLIERLGDIRPAHVEDIDGIGVIAGDLWLSRFEQRLTEAWSDCLDDNPANARDAFRVTTAFHRVIREAAQRRSADVAFLDVGPSLGALNRAALVASDAVVVPLSADLYSLRGLQNLGPTLAEWRKGWAKRRELARSMQEISLPSGAMQALGYVVLQHAAKKRNEPANAYSRWIQRFPAEFHSRVLEQAPPEGEDPARIAMLRHFRSLMPMALEARKPVFDLRASDGAIGSHAAMVRDAETIFESLAREIAQRAGVVLPPGARSLDADHSERA
ncbi:MAG: ParA family protein [Planctomycetes bacterium]|nr:ParA family protein [Planctomycetota bacterium]